MLIRERPVGGDEGRSGAAGVGVVQQHETVAESSDVRPKRGAEKLQMREGSVAVDGARFDVADVGEESVEQDE